MKLKGFYVIITVLVVLIMTIAYFWPKPTNWQITYNPDDKIPFGTYVLYDLLPGFLEVGEVPVSRVTLTQHDVKKDSLQIGPENVLILAQNFSGSETDIHSLLENAAEGDHYCIGASGFSATLLDTLNLSLEVAMAIDEINDAVYGQPTYTTIKSDYSRYNETEYSIRQQWTTYAFNLSDSSVAEILAYDNEKRPVIIRHSIGEGSITLSSVPLAFTNYNMLQEGNEELVELALSAMPSENPTVLNMYYQLGALPSVSHNSMFGYIGHVPALRYAFLLAYILLIVFVIFQAKRRQRIIPIIETPANTSLEFTETIGRLYYQRGDHANLAQKKIDYFLSFVRTQYFISTNELDDHMAEWLHKKSGVARNKVDETLAAIRQFRAKRQIDQRGLMDLNEKIEQFYN